MQPVIQEETTGCGIACVATIAGTSYATAKSKANKLGIFAEDESLFSETTYVRTLLNAYGFQTGEKEELFSEWSELPDTALLATKWHLENGRPFWHWVVFNRGDRGAVVLDPTAYLSRNERIDFEEIQPKWFIRVD